MAFPRFATLHQGPWPYPPQDGVGMKLEGVPSDPHAFIDVLQGYSCNPAATRRILAILQRGEAKYTTVSATLDFDGIGASLANLGVTLSIVPPAVPDDPTPDHLVLRLTNGEAVDLTQLPPEVARVVEERWALMQESLRALPHDLGAYGP